MQIKLTKIVGFESKTRLLPLFFAVAAYNTKKQSRKVDKNLKNLSEMQSKVDKLLLKTLKVAE